MRKKKLTEFVKNAWNIFSLCQLLIDELIVSKLLQVLLSQIWGKNIYGVFLFEDYVLSRGDCFLYDNGLRHEGVNIKYAGN